MGRIKDLLPEAEQKQYLLVAIDRATGHAYIAFKSFDKFPQRHHEPPAARLLTNSSPHIRPSHLNKIGQRIIHTARMNPQPR